MIYNFVLCSIILSDCSFYHAKDIRNRLVEPFEFTTNYVQIWCYDIEEFPLAERDIKQLNPERWLLDTKVCDYRGVARFAIGLADDVEIVDSPGLEKWFYFTIFVNKIDSIMNEIEISFFQALEDGIAGLPEEQRAKIFRPCAVNCVKNTVLPFLKQRFDACAGNLDQFFDSRFDNEYSFQKVVKEGHVYEFGYPKCFCPLQQSGFARSLAHCECSRQSILFILEELFPGCNFRVEIMDTVLNGAGKCSFSIVSE